MRTLLLIFALAYTAIGQTPKCPGPYIAVGTGCYSFPETVVSSWIKASPLCQFSGGYLAYIESEEEQIALAAYHDAHFPDTYYRWLGATDMITNDVWRWAPSGAPVIYSNWLSGEPIQDCAVWSTVYNNWYTIWCCDDYAEIKPLCEADPL